MKKTRQKNVKPATRKAYERAAAAADNKLAAAELAFDSDPSEENKAVVQQARAKACAASAKLILRTGGGVVGRGEGEGDKY